MNTAVTATSPHSMSKFGILPLVIRKFVPLNDQICTTNVGVLESWMANSRPDHYETRNGMRCLFPGDFSRSGTMMPSSRTSLAGE